MGLDGAEHAAREGEESGDELERASYDDAYKAEGQEDEPDQWKKEECGEGQRPTKERQKTEEQEVEHGIFSP
jgi:hypothetical protein